MGSNTIQGAGSPSDLITSTTVAATEALDVYIQGGAVTGSEYTDDSNEFTIATSDGQAMMAVFTTDVVDAGDIGVLSMTSDRKLRVDGSFSSVGNMGTDDNSIATGQENQNVNSLLYGYDAVADVWERCQTDESNILRVRISDGTDAAVLPDMMASAQDEATDALAVVSGCYGYRAAGGVGVKALPLIIDDDDGSLVNSQSVQLVMNENYIYPDGGVVWSRWNGDVQATQSGTWTDVGIKSPLNTGFKSFDHPDQEVNRVVWQDPIYRDGHKNNLLPPGNFQWTVPVGSTGAYTAGVGALLFPFDGTYCLNLYEASGVFDYSNMPFKWMGCPWDDSGPSSATKVAVIEGRFQAQDAIDDAASYTFGITIWDGTARYEYIIDIHAAVGVYNAYVGTGDAANAIIAATTIAIDGWNYFRLDVYPPQHSTGPLFKSLIINGTSYAVGALAPYNVVSAFNGCSPKACTFLSTLGTDAMWDDFTFWTYYEAGE